MVGGRDEPPQPHRTIFSRAPRRAGREILFHHNPSHVGRDGGEQTHAGGRRGGRDRGGGARARRAEGESRRRRLERRVHRDRDLDEGHDVVAAEGRQAHVLAGRSDHAPGRARGRRERREVLPGRYRPRVVRRGQGGELVEGLRRLRGTSRVDRSDPSIRPSIRLVHATVESNKPYSAFVHSAAASPTSPPPTPPPSPSTARRTT